MLASIIILVLFFAVQIFAVQKKGTLGFYTNVLSEDKEYKREYTYIVLSSFLVLGTLVYIFLSGKTLESMYITIPSFTTDNFNFWLLLFAGIVYLFIASVLFFLVFISNKINDSSKFGLPINNVKIESEKDKENVLKTLSIFKQDKGTLKERLNKFEQITITKLILGFIASNLILIFVLDLILYHTNGLNTFTTVLTISSILAIFNRKFTISGFISNVIALSVYIVLVLASNSIIFFAIISLLLLMMTQNIVNIIKKTVENKEVMIEAIEKSLSEYEEKKLQDSEDKHVS